MLKINDYRWIALLLAACLCVGCLTGCGRAKQPAETSAEASGSAAEPLKEPSPEASNPPEKEEEEPAGQGLVFRLPEADREKQLKILMVGNSFSVDSTEFLYEVADDAGYDVLIGNLNRSSTPLADHWGFAENESAVYTYRKNDSGKWEVLARKSATMSDALEDEPWDIILFQQQSYQAGVPHTYHSKKSNYMTNLASYAREHCSNDQVKIGWEMTWALSHCTEEYYLKRFSGELDLYEKICETVQEEIAKPQAVDLIIPTGTAIQNARSSYLGDTLDRDGKHLSYDLGRYLAAMSIASGCGMDLTEVDRLDTSVSAKSKGTFSTRHLAVLKQSVADSEQTPYAVTQQSQETPELERPQLTVTATEGGAETLTWQAVEGATGYQVSRRTAEDDGEPVFTVLDANTLSYTDEGEGQGIYRVAALGDAYLKWAVSNKVSS